MQMVLYNMIRVHKSENRHNSAEESRSYNMSRIRSTKTIPEMYIRRLLYHEGFRYRVNCINITGKPDLYFSGKRAAIFIHGCFWHRHIGCRYAYMPKSNQVFWEAKFDNNIRRDLTVSLILKDQHIRQLIIWECTIRRMMKNRDDESVGLGSLVAFINNTELNEMEI